MRKPDLAYAKTKGADQCPCFHYIDTCSTIPLLPQSEISSLWPSSMAVLPGLCSKTVFLATRLILSLQ